MSVRKVFTTENGKELSYHVTFIGELNIEIQMADGTIAEIELEPGDALQLIQELNRLRKNVSSK